MKLETTSESGRLQVALFIAGLLISLGTAAITLNVKAELLETRILLLEKISEAGRNYATRPEFEQLRERVTNLEQRRSR
jgi:hypothetical protein